MDVVLYIILLAISGLFVGALGRLALPGPDPMSIPQTILIGIAGSFLAGLILGLIFGAGAGSLLVSILFATGIVYAIRRSRGGTLTEPAPRDRLPRDRVR